MPGWEEQEVDGKTFDVLIQGQEADCGLCSAAMIMNLLGQGKPKSSTIKGLLQQGDYQPSTRDRSGFAPSLLSMTVVRTEDETHSTGTYLDRLAAVLAQYNIKGKHYYDNVAKGINNAKSKRPIICHVTWDNGGGHWVVVAKSSGRKHYVLDPFYGVTVNRSTTTYTARGGVTGRWTGEWLKTSL